MSRSLLRPAVAALLVAAVAPAALAAQGSISGQGFGYPTGQLTVRAQSTGGAFAESDPAAPVNPAALFGWIVMGASAQYTPELRTTTADARSVRATLPRFPVFSFGLPIGQKFFLGISAASLLERNFFAQTSGTQEIRGETVSSFTTNNVRGNMSDLRFALAYQPASWLRVGGAWHFIGGENRVAIQRRFTRPIPLPDGTSGIDSTTYGSISERTELGFSGQAYSLGIDVRTLPGLFVSASIRRGFTLQTEVGRLVPSSAEVPGRTGISVRYEGLPGARLAARYETVSWSDMAALGSGNTATFDTRELGAGVELNGPQIQKVASEVRFGWRTRQLPFGVGGVRPDETGIGGGIGLPLARGRYIVDLGAERLTRSVPGLAGVRERAWVLAFGVRVRP